jgi:hypothetical protein
VEQHVYPRTVVSVCLHYQNPTQRVGLVKADIIVISSNVTCCRSDIAEKLNNNHLLYKKLKHNIFVTDEIQKCVLHFCTACCPFTFNWLAMAVSHKFTLVFIYRVFCILVDAFIYNMLSTCLKIL